MSCITDDDDTQIIALDTSTISQNFKIEAELNIEPDLDLHLSNEYLLKSQNLNLISNFCDLEQLSVVAAACTDELEKYLVTIPLHSAESLLLVNQTDIIPSTSVGTITELQSNVNSKIIDDEKLNTDYLTDNSIVSISDENVNCGTTDVEPNKLEESSPCEDISSLPTEVNWDKNDLQHVATEITDNIFDLTSPNSLKPKEESAYMFCSQESRHSDIATIMSDHDYLTHQYSSEIIAGSISSVKPLLHYEMNYESLSIQDLIDLIKRKTVPEDFDQNITEGTSIPTTNLKLLSIITNQLLNSNSTTDLSKYINDIVHQIDFLIVANNEATDLSDKKPPTEFLFEQEDVEKGLKFVDGEKVTEPVEEVPKIAEPIEQVKSVECNDNEEQENDKIECQLLSSQQLNEVNEPANLDNNQAEDEHPPNESIDHFTQESEPLEQSMPSELNDVDTNHQLDPETMKVCSDFELLLTFTENKYLDLKMFASLHNLDDVKQKYEEFLKTIEDKIKSIKFVELENINPVEDNSPEQPIGNEVGIQNEITTNVEGDLPNPNENEDSNCHNLPIIDNLLEKVNDECQLDKGTLGSEECETKRNLRCKKRFLEEISSDSDISESENSHSSYSFKRKLRLRKKKVKRSQRVGSSSDAKDSNSDEADIDNSSSPSSNCSSENEKPPNSVEHPVTFDKIEDEGADQKGAEDTGCRADLEEVQLENDEMAAIIENPVTSNLDQEDGTENELVNNDGVVVHPKDILLQNTELHDSDIENTVAATAVNNDLSDNDQSNLGINTTTSEEKLIEDEHMVDEAIPLQPNEEDHTKLELEIELKSKDIPSEIPGNENYNVLKEQNNERVNEEIIAEEGLLPSTNVLNAANDETSKAIEDLLNQHRSDSVDYEDCTLSDADFEGFHSDDCVVGDEDVKVKLELHSEESAPALDNVTASLPADDVNEKQEDTIENNMELEQEQEIEEPGFDNKLLHTGELTNVEIEADDIKEKNLLENKISDFITEGVENMFDTDLENVKISEIKSADEFIDNLASELDDESTSFDPSSMLDIKLNEPAVSDLPSNPYFDSHDYDLEPDDVDENTEIDKLENIDDMEKKNNVKTEEQEQINGHDNDGNKILNNGLDGEVENVELKQMDEQMDDINDEDPEEESDEEDPEETLEKEINRLLDFKSLDVGRKPSVSNSVYRGSTRPKPKKKIDPLMELLNDETKKSVEENSSESEEEEVSEKQYIKQCNMSMRDKIISKSDSESDSSSIDSELQQNETVESSNESVYDISEESDDSLMDKFLRKANNKIIKKEKVDKDAHETDNILENGNEQSIPINDLNGSAHELDNTSMDAEVQDLKEESKRNDNLTISIEDTDKKNESESNLSDDKSETGDKKKHTKMDKFDKLVFDKNLFKDDCLKKAVGEEGLSSSTNSDCEILDVSMFPEKKLKNMDEDEMVKALSKNRTVKKRTSKAPDDCISLSSDSDAESTKPSDDEEVSADGKKRVQRRMLRGDQLAHETKLAQREENERVKRLEKKQDRLKKILSESKDKQTALPGQLEEIILDYDTKFKKFISVHPDIVKHLKPHQVEGIKFMYDSCYGSVDHIEKHSGSGCILAHCMGLGKTLQLIALLHTVIRFPQLKTKKVLVICPKSTVMNWGDEIKRWLGPIKMETYLKIYYFEDNTDINAKVNILKSWHESGRSGHIKAGCLLIGYEAFRTLVFFHKRNNNLASIHNETIKKCITDCLLNPGADLVICDEGHMIKNRKSATSLAVNEIQTRRRIVLTGTPIQNNLKEYYSMVNFIKPSFLGTEKEFANLYANPIKNGQHKDSSKAEIKYMKQRSYVLHKKLSRFVQRREAALLKTFLPAKYEYVLFIPLTPIQEVLYQYFLDNNPLKEEYGGKSLIPDYTFLRKVWTHPKVIENAWQNAVNAKQKAAAQRAKRQYDSEEEPPDDVLDSQEGKMSVTSEWWRQFVTKTDLESLLPSHKLKILFEILKICEENGEKCLIFSAFVAVLDVVEHFMKQIHRQDYNSREYGFDKFRGPWVLGSDYYRLDGKTPRKLRHQMIKSFNEPTNTRTRCFLISAKAGGQGINLIGANRVIILDTSWNPSNDQQNIFRVFRLGQKRICYIYRLLAMGTMEEKVYSRSVTKQAMSFRVVDEQQIDRHYSMAELAELYTLTKPDFSQRETPVRPYDNVLASLLHNFPNLVFKYHEHDSLLEKKTEQDLSEEEKADAWAAYERDVSVKNQAINGIGEGYNFTGQSQFPNNFGMGFPSPMQMPNPYDPYGISSYFNLPPYTSKEDLMMLSNQMYGPYASLLASTATGRSTSGGLPSNFANLYNQATALFNQQRLPTTSSNPLSNYAQTAAVNSLAANLMGLTQSPTYGANANSTLNSLLNSTMLPTSVPSIFPNTSTGINRPSSSGSSELDSLMSIQEKLAYKYLKDANPLPYSLANPINQAFSKPTTTVANSSSMSNLLTGLGTSLPLSSPSTMTNALANQLSKSITSSSFMPTSTSTSSSSITNKTPPGNLMTDPKVPSIPTSVITRTTTPSPFSQLEAIKMAHASISDRNSPEPHIIMKNVNNTPAHQQPKTPQPQQLQQAHLSSFDHRRQSPSLTSQNISAKNTLPPKLSPSFTGALQTSPTSEIKKHIIQKQKEQVQQLMSKQQQRQQTQLPLPPLTKSLNTNQTSHRGVAVKQQPSPIQNIKSTHQQVSKPGLISQNTSQHQLVKQMSSKVGTQIQSPKSAAAAKVTNMGIIYPKPTESLMEGTSKQISNVDPLNVLKTAENQLAQLTKRNLQTTVRHLPNPTTSNVTITPSPLSTSIISAARRSMQDAITVRPGQSPKSSTNASSNSTASVNRLNSLTSAGSSLTITPTRKLVSPSPSVSNIAASREGLSINPVSSSSAIKNSLNTKAATIKAISKDNKTSMSTLNVTTQPKSPSVTMTKVGTPNIVYRPNLVGRKTNQASTPTGNWSTVNKQLGAPPPLSPLVSKPATRTILVGNETSTNKRPLTASASKISSASPSNVTARIVQSGGFGQNKSSSPHIVNVSSGSPHTSVTGSLTGRSTQRTTVNPQTSTSILSKQLSANLIQTPLQSNAQGLPVRPTGNRPTLLGKRNADSAQLAGLSSPASSTTSQLKRPKIDTNNTANTSLKKLRSFQGLTITRNNGNKNNSQVTQKSNSDVVELD